MSESAPRPRIRFLALGLSALVGAPVLLPAGTLAQEPGVPADEPLLQGIVAEDATGRPIGSATLSLVGIEGERQTDAAGRFIFPDAPMGLVTIRVQASGYVTMVEEVEVTPEAISFVQFFLPELSAALGDLFEPVDGSPERIVESGSAADLLARRVLGTRQTPGMVGQTDFTILLRGVSSLSLSGEPALFLDGVRVSGGLRGAFDVLSQIPASDVEDIRVMRGPASVGHTFGADGAIYVQTRSGPDN